MEQQYNIRSSFQESDDDNFSIDALVSRLQRDVEDLDASLEHFHSDRLAAIEQQKIAWVKYEEEMAQIEREYMLAEQGVLLTLDQQAHPRKPVDHNILKHLNIDRRSEILALEAENNANSTNQDAENEYNLDDFSRTSNLPHTSNNKKLPKKFGEQFHQEQNIPPPSFEEKKKAREQMFDYFEESAVEETRLELDLEQAKLKNDTKLVEELSEALFYLQRLHNDKLNAMVSSYRPQLFGKNWGQDPDYQQMSKQLKSISDAFHAAGLSEVNTTHNNNNSNNSDATMNMLLPEVNDEKHKQKAKKQKNSAKQVKK